MSRSGALAWPAALTAACWGVLASAALVATRFDGNLWDNFEYFTPAIRYAHGLWLSGRVPLWNPHQHLGEPLLAAGQPGALYPGYTVAVAALQALGWDAGRLPFVIVALHAPLAAIGWWLLARRLGVRASLAGVGALAVTFGGFVTAIATVWIFMFPVFASTPWILYGLVRMLAVGGWAGAVPLAAGLAATACVGHPQMLLYQWLTAGLFLAGLALAVSPPRRRLARTALALAMAAALSLPALLPMAELFGLSVRTESYGLDQFLRRGVQLSALAGWLLPSFVARNGFMPDRASVMGYQGAWMVPALLGGLLALWLARRRANGPDLTRPAFVVTLAAAGVLLLLAMGGQTPLYPLTYGIPIWSSLRWPFKFLIFSQPMLLLAATLGLELWARPAPRPPRWRLLPVAGYMAAVAVVAWALPLAAPRGAADVLGLAGAGLTLAALPALGHRWSHAALLAGTLASAVALTAQAHDMGMKRYPEPYGRVGAAALGVTEPSRVLPLTPQKPREAVMQPLALLHSATANDYDGATGYAEGLIVRWFAETLPLDVFGVPRAGIRDAFLASHLLRSFNIGYVVVGADDEAGRRAVAAAGRFTRIREGERSTTYRTDDVLPRAYFASRTYRATKEAVGEGLLANRVPVDSAFVDGWAGPETPAVGRVLGAAWDADRVAIDVDAPQGGVLVVSVSFYPGWHATVDGRPVGVHRVNHRVMGVVVPAGARRVALEFHSPALRLGLIAAVLGCGGPAVGLAIVAWLRRRRPLSG